MAGVVGGNAHIWTTQWSTINESLATYPCGLVHLVRERVRQGSTMMLSYLTTMVWNNWNGGICVICSYYFHT